MRMNARKQVLQYRELNANIATQHQVHKMPPTKAPIIRMMQNLWPEMKTLDDLAEWCAMPQVELQNYIASGFKRCMDFTDSVYYNQYFSYLNNV